MTGRRVGLLLLAAVLIIALGLWSTSRKVENAQSGAGALVLKELKSKLNDVTEVRIIKGDGSRVTLRKRPNDWLVGERDYPADTTKVRKLVIDLSSLATIETKTNDPEKYSQLGVQDVTSPAATGTRVEAVTAEKVLGVIVGKASGAKSGYVRATDSKQSLLATPAIQADADPKRWLDVTLLDIPESRVKEIEVQATSGPAFRATRETKEQNDFTVPGLPKGRELATPSAANPLASNLILLTLTDVRKAADGAAASASSAAPAAASAPAKGAAAKGGAGASATSQPRAVFRTFDGLEIQLTGQVEGERRFVSIVPVSTAKETADEAQKLEARVKGWQFEIPNYKYDSLFRPLEEFLNKVEPKADAKPAAKAGGAKLPRPAAPPALPQSPAN